MPYIGRGDFNYRVIRWYGCSIWQEPAGVDDLDMAIACYEIAVRKYPGELVTLQQGIRVIRKSRED
jgi:hypothetical protein